MRVSVYEWKTIRNERTSGCSSAHECGAFITAGNYLFCVMMEKKQLSFSRVLVFLSFHKRKFYIGKEIAFTL